MNNFILYIVLSCCPLFVTAQQDDDIAVQDSLEKYAITPDTTVTNEGQEVIADTLEIVVKKMAPPLNATVAPGIKKRSFNADFKQKYTDTDYKYEVKSAAKTRWDRFLEWLRDILDWLLGDNPSNKDGGFNWPDLLLKTAAVIIFGFIVYFIARAVLDKEGMWIFGKSRKKIVVQDADAENIHEMDFGALIEETRANADYKLAVRYYYLWLLKKLSNREIIDWHWDKTNTDYLYEIKNADLRADFEYLSYVYDYSWYGDFKVDEKAFAKAERAFKKTLNTL